MMDSQERYLQRPVSLRSIGMQGCFTPLTETKMGKWHFKRRRGKITLLVEDTDNARDDRKDFAQPLPRG